MIIIVDASAYFMSRGWLRIKTKPTPPTAICAMRLHSLLTLKGRGYVFIINNVYDDNNKLLWPTWAVGALFRSVRCIHINQVCISLVEPYHITTSPLPLGDTIAPAHYLEAHTDTLPHTATYCRSAARCRTLSHCCTAGQPHAAAHTAAHCRAHCRTLLCAVPHIAARTAAHCHTVTHCHTLPRTLQQTAAHYRTTAHCRTAIVHCRAAAHCRAHCRTAAHCQTHCHTLPCPLPHTATCTATYSRAHCRTLSHCRTAAHCRAHCHTLLRILPYTA